MPYSLFLFDYDGTLCDTRAAITHALRRTFQELNQGALPAALLDGILGHGLPMPEAFTRLLPKNATSPPLDTWLQTYRAIYRDEAEPLVTLYPGATEALEATRAQGHEVVVISNKNITILESSLRRFQLRDYASLVLGEDPAARPPLPLKPAAALFTQRIQPRFPAIRPAQVLMIGDTATDLCFARNCGVAACWASYGFGSAADCNPLQPAHSISSLAELLPLLSA